jgi:hypothetical protein
MKCFDLKSELEAVVQEIMDYKWIESEREGHDIGTRRAAFEWIERYYDTWFAHNCNKFFREQ